MEGGTWRGCGGGGKNQEANGQHRGEEADLFRRGVELRWFATPAFVTGVETE